MHSLALLAAILVAILNFCRTCKKLFIAETVQDRAISTKTLFPRGRLRHLSGNMVAILHLSQKQCEME